MMVVVADDDDDAWIEEGRRNSAFSNAVNVSENRSNSESRLTICDVKD